MKIKKKKTTTIVWRKNQNPVDCLLSEKFLSLPIHSFFFFLTYLFPCGSVVKDPPTMRETWVRSLAWEDPLEMGKATTPVFWSREFHGLYRVAKSRTRLSDFHFTSLSSDQISRSVVSNSLQPHESQHARPPCPSPTPGVHSDSCPTSQ